MNEGMFEWILGISFILIGSFSISKYKKVRYIPQPEPHRDQKEISIDYALLIGGICFVVAGLLILFQF
jgi:hypothetical protein